MPRIRDGSGKDIVTIEKEKEFRISRVLVSGIKDLRSLKRVYFPANMPLHFVKYQHMTFDLFERCVFSQLNFIIAYALRTIELTSCLTFFPVHARDTLSKPLPNHVETPPFPFPLLFSTPTFLAILRVRFN